MQCRAVSRCSLVNFSYSDVFVESNKKSISLVCRSSEMYFLGMFHINRNKLRAVLSPACLGLLPACYTWHKCKEVARGIHGDLKPPELVPRDLEEQLSES